MAERDGYVFEPLTDDVYSFKALKLSQLTIKVCSVALIIRTQQSRGLVNLYFYV